MKQFNYIFLIILSLNVTGYDRITGLEFASRSEVIATNGMAATSHPLATQTAISILKNGGNAIDAAIAANAVLGLVEPTGCGIGGDLFAIIWSADEKKLFGLNSSGPAPKNISINKLKQKGLEKIPPYGPLPVTVPGAVAGWVSIHKKFGLLEFNKLFNDAINYAENGFPVSELVSYYLERSSEIFAAYPNFKDVWMPNGKTPKKGEIFINKNLAENYKEIANTYGKSFYSGKIAENIVNTVNAQGGFFSMSDLNSFEKLISKEYANERSKLINLKKSSKSFNPGNLEIGDTIYLTVADSFGNMVSLIQSNYRGMGSGVVPANTGFMLQDRGEMFSLDPNHMNSLMPGKRPFHTIIPAFVTKNDKPFISFGLMGGAMQPQGHAQIIVNLVDFKMNLQEAGDAPRIRHVGSSQPTGEKMLDGGYLSLEKSFDKNEISKLKKMGHKFQYDLGGFGGYQAIMIKDGVYYGASESRKDGHASGY